MLNICFLPDQFDAATVTRIVSQTLVIRSFAHAPARCWYSFRMDLVEIYYGKFNICRRIVGYSTADIKQPLYEEWLKKEGHKY